MEPKILLNNQQDHLEAKKQEKLKKLKTTQTQGKEIKGRRPKNQRKFQKE